MMVQFTAPQQQFAGARRELGMPGKSYIRIKCCQRFVVECVGYKDVIGVGGALNPQ